MSSVNRPAMTNRKDTKARELDLPLHLLEMILVHYLFPVCTWGRVEECVGWCREVIVNPLPVQRIGREWLARAKAMRHLLKALFVRATPQEFCRGVGVPHEMAILLGKTLDGNSVWKAEICCEDPGIVLVNPQDFSSHIWWARRCAGGTEPVYRRRIELEPPSWYNVVNPGIQGRFYQLWRDLNMLYERLSLPWKMLQIPDLRMPIHQAIDMVFSDTCTLWDIRRGNMENYEDAPIEERVRAYAEGEILPALGARTLGMRLDYDLWDETVESATTALFLQFRLPKDKPPRKLYRQHCTLKELSILNRECGIAGTPWKYIESEEGRHSWSMF